MSLNGKDPGAARHGNFINYYQFHPPGNRVKHLPSHLRRVNKGEDLICLDIGCNAGDLTQLLFEFLSQSATLPVETSEAERTTGKCYILAVDLDPLLIRRAADHNRNPENVSYVCLDFLSDSKETAMSEYLKQHGRLRFDVVFCFSVTMWIHLNHGDAGLKRFLSKAAGCAEIVVVEPQPWRCYRSAVRRMRRCQEEVFPEYGKLTIRGNVESEIRNFLDVECGFDTIQESLQTEWGRKIMCYKRRT